MCRCALAQCAPTIEAVCAARRGEARLVQDHLILVAPRLAYLGEAGYGKLLAMGTADEPDPAAPVRTANAASQAGRSDLWNDPRAQAIAEILAEAGHPGAYPERLEGDEADEFYLSLLLPSYVDDLGDTLLSLGMQEGRWIIHSTSADGSSAFGSGGLDEDVIDADVTDQDLLAWILEEIENWQISLGPFEDVE